MENTCSYCNSLKVAIQGDNMCSVNGSKSPMNSVGNSFYLKSNKLSTGQHISRLTFRGVLSGYQHYKVEGKEYLLNNESYLMVEKGANYSSEIRSITPIESVIVAFADGTSGEVSNTLTHKPDKLLDNITLKDFPEEDEVDLSGYSYTSTPEITVLLKVIKRSIIDGDEDPLFYEQLHYALMGALVKNRLGIHRLIKNLDGVRKSTRIELFRRANDARDYIEANFHKKLTLSSLSRVAAMSPYHFLRVFKRIFLCTPQEFITRRRLKYARYLLRNSEMSVQEITASCGFDNHSSFARLFKSRLQISPSAFRNQSYQVSKIRTAL